MDSKEIQPVHPKILQSWILIGKDSNAGRDWGQEEKGTTQDKMAGWHHGLDGWIWVNSGRWRWTGRPGVLRFMGSQRVGHDWVTELNWPEWLMSLGIFKNMLIGHLCVFLGEIFIQNLCPFCNQVICCSKTHFYVLNARVQSNRWFADIFSHFVGFLVNFLTGVLWNPVVPSS